MKCLFAAALSASLLFGATASRANGRFPRGEHLIEHPSDPKHLTLAATYGLLTTEDGGQSWYYICETAFSLNPPPPPGDPGYTGDPLVTLMPDESLLVGAQKRITLSSDRACGWQKVFEDVTKSVDDIAIAPSNRNTVVALMSTFGGAPVLQVHESTDMGRTWAAIGVPLPITVGLTLDVDPKDPTHIYVTGLTSTTSGVGDTGVFLTTTNRGASWTISTIPKTSIDAPPYIAAVHPTDPKKIFVRTNEWTDSITANDALLYSKDGGQTWTELLRPVGPEAGAKLFAFALSPDGNTVLAGFGDPIQGGGQTVDRTVTGVYKSTGADYSFGPNPTRLVDELVSCLTWTTNGVYMCGSPDGMTSYIGFVKDVNMLSNAGLMRIMELKNAKGPPACCNGRARTTCDWATDCVRFQSCGSNGGMVPPYDASACVMPEAGPDTGRGGSGGAPPADAGSDTRPDTSAGSAGTGGTTGTAGAAGAEAGTKAGAGGASGSSSGGNGGSTGGATTGSGGTAGSNDSCGCRLAAANDQESGGRFAFLLAGIAAANMRRGRRSKARRL